MLSKRIPAKQACKKKQLPIKLSAKVAFIDTFEEVVVDQKYNMMVNNPGATYEARNFSLGISNTVRISKSLPTEPNPDEKATVHRAEAGVRQFNHPSTGFQPLGFC